MPLDPSPRRALVLGGAGMLAREVAPALVSPTWTRELAAQLAVLVASDAPPGVYHATAAGETSWYDAAVFALRRAGLDAPVEPVATAEYGSKTPRPPYSVLAPAALAARGLYRMRAWDAALLSWLEGPAWTRDLTRRPAAARVGAHGPSRGGRGRAVQDHPVLAGAAHARRRRRAPLVFLERGVGAALRARRFGVCGGSFASTKKSQHVTINYRVLKNGVDAP
jgi:hypothetical protein